MPFKPTLEEIYSQDEDGFYPIHKLARNECDDYGGTNADLKKLVKIAPDFNLDTKDKVGRTALHIACYCGKPFMAELLMKLGANKEAIDDKGFTPIFYALEGTNKSVKDFCEAGVDLNHRAHNGFTPIYYAIDIGKVGAVTTLTKYDIDLSCEDNLPMGLISKVLDSPKSWSHSNLGSMVRALIRKGAKVNHIDEHGRNESFKLCKTLSAKDYNYKDWLKILKSIITAGSNPWKKDSSGVSSFKFLDLEGIEILKPALKKLLKNKEISIAASITTANELKGFFFNQTKLSKSEVLEFLPEGSEAKESFKDILALPPVMIEG